ncbi:restriction endonuclease (plasmid) [Pseudochrobactrum algeriensis]|uniref:restriction endonuclease n=1 Tax=Pseudochrobactrum algeriensis TaxID=2834768 RepID=UPI001BCC6BBD|nr:restriction endonuclease [Pseudochrobactrum algeriensis]QVQ35434.1 restriction endonuclease [Pseudochrobactrum algeriensis]QVQ42049.1 restriction endonuclease [Pseudochrobactrum algeriensis]QVQ42307.1 restriction endonuclease [Pseudochrobactrum algeriensis]
MSTIQVSSKYLKSIKLGQIEAKSSADGSRILRYYVNFWHNELNLHKDLSAPELYLLQGKVDALMSDWDKKYEAYLTKTKLVASKEEAETATVEAQSQLDRLSQILSHTLNVDDRINWDSLKKKETYKRKSYSTPSPKLVEYNKPSKQWPIISIWDRIFGKAKKKLAEANEQHIAALNNWEEINLSAFKKHEAETNNWMQLKDQFEAAETLAKNNFDKEQQAYNAKIDQLADGVSKGDTNSVIEHASLVLELSDYDDLFEKSYQIEYQPEDKILLVQYELPSPDKIPTLKQVRFVASTGEMKETHISDREKKNNFDAVCYQICLRTIHELFEADENENIQKILFNGTTSYIDRTTGQDATACIMSVLVDREKFMSIDLGRIDPKACFKNLKGVSAASLAALAAIPPVIEMNRDDRRFIEGRNTIDAIDYATNLAAMDWGDFEHLVRELFEKEFASRGGEVKVTQSSSDGGVDAVAFDPDPITGGKFVIQAKRYTRTVGVSAVRDLFGTMQHEGASRGILVTTADYGPDAYKFASEKPITLLSGSNLLHLLEKHGYNAKIDIREARQTMYS